MAAFASLLLLTAMSGCKSQKDYLYLSDMTDDQGYAITHRYQPRIQRDDRLEITVSCKIPELAMPFNVTSGSVKVTEGGKVSGNVNEQYYRVDNEGDINFPVLGKLYVAGLTLSEASGMIRQRIIDGNYIKDPIVTMEFKNFHYTVLGAANGNGTHTCDGDRITILEAIAQAGDLASNADLGKIAVIREEGQHAQGLYRRHTQVGHLQFAGVLSCSERHHLCTSQKPKSEEKTNFLQWLTVALSIVTATTSVIWVTK